MRRLEFGRAVFALTMVALGVSGLGQGDFAAIWQPVSTAVPGREALATLSNLGLIATGGGLLWRRGVVMAGGALLVWLLLWLLLVKGRGIWLAPAAAVSWESGGETAILAAGVWALYATSAGGFRHLEIAGGASGLRVARVVCGLALIAFGLAHLAYIEETSALVPAWLPSPAAWVYLTGATYIAAGAAMVIGRMARLAATLAAVQIGLFTLLVWGPTAAAGTADSSQWNETILSWALTAAAWAVADSYRGEPWLAFGMP
jgi:uncharacterized membrane protein YphA (DoxX/SURF4 family)